ncbi:putative membrane protein (TIGR02234 family) [Geodermatophilus bullaregiensis]|uniref:Trp biosynthesis-associated membrane protein n=1 Tax=Geodermatophilus bullaregiensis TaxID=1564160 RepID=UPI0019560DE4|nr:Trp biosynthesis-associated membrane protein [Geodermatophilus bullaregiensis]MBM7804738.1 putative membrane protein (TIGR02234 family) [Geodermatophilus bullaregiensis]
MSGSAVPPAPPDGSGPGTPDPRRELGAAVAGCALAGGLALSAGGQTWATVTVTRPPPLPPVTEALAGSAVAPLATAAGLLLLAAAVAVLAVRGVGRAAVGVLVAAAGVVLAWAGGRVLVAGPDPVPTAPGETVSTDLSAGWPVLCLVAAAVALAAGLLVLARGRRWPGMGRRYERTPGAAAPAPARARTDEDRALDAWRALDRGDDPTDDPTGDPTGDLAGDPVADPAPGVAATTDDPATRAPGRRP